MNFCWVKKGRLIASPALGYTHTSLPCVTKLDDDDFLFAFSSRDAQRRSYIFLVRGQVRDGTIAFVDEPQLALEPGNTGFFDEDGVISGTFCEINGQTYLYYIGWQTLASVPQANTIGRAICDTQLLSLKREFSGPIVGRSVVNPLFLTCPFMLAQNDIIHMWYGSGIRWWQADNIWNSSYNIRHAVSSDGLTWQHDSNFSMYFITTSETVVARPSIVYLNGLYHMWYCRVDTLNAPTYRIGYATSKDLCKWERFWNGDNTIDISKTGWDSQMVCHPYVFKHKDFVYMLYDGNSFGRDGFGYAVSQVEDATC